ncbi:MAG: M50 family metallopeptidase [Gemmataceae bacterium]|nr:M50 family metallopeptidase [Gemmataceae bacterium]
MDPTRGAFKLFRLAGVEVWLHWMWLPFAFLMVALRPDAYASPAWKAVEYVALAASVLAHEFGHVLACRSVGGTARTIVLWPLGGIALVSPPARPGALLWSIAGGPLANLVLAVPFALLALLVPADTWKDLHVLLATLALMNVLLCAFNLLPAYPLDGGQMLHALLWFRLGRWKGLQAASAVGVALGAMILFGAVALVPLLARQGLPFELPLVLAVVAAFMALQSAATFQAVRQVLMIEALPRRTDCACPSCHSAPFAGPLWVCDECRTRFDVYETRGKCPACGAWYLQQACLGCRATAHIDRWFEYLPGKGLERPEEEREA